MDVEGCGRGLLTGKIKPGHQFNVGDPREGNRYYTDENIKRINALLDKITELSDGLVPAKTKRV